MGVATFKRSFLLFLIFYRCQPYSTYSYCYIIGTFWLQFFALHLLMSWPSTTTKSGIKIQGVRGKGLKHKGSLSARVTFLPTFSLEVWFHGKCREYIVQLIITWTCENDQNMGWGRLCISGEAWLVPFLHHVSFSRESTGYNQKGRISCGINDKYWWGKDQSFGLVNLPRCKCIGLHRCVLVLPGRLVAWTAHTGCNT